MTNKYLQAPATHLLSHPVLSNCIFSATRTKQTDRQTDKQTDKQTKKTNTQTNKPTNQPTNQQTNKQTRTANQPPTSQTNKQPTNQQTNQPTNQPTNHPTNQHKQASKQASKAKQSKAKQSKAKQSKRANTHTHKSQALSAMHGQNAAHQIHTHQVRPVDEYISQLAPSTTRPHTQPTGLCGFCHFFPLLAK